MRSEELGLEGRENPREVSFGDDCSSTSENSRLPCRGARKVTGKTSKALAVVPKQLGGTSAPPRLDLPYDVGASFPTLGESPASVIRGEELPWIKSLYSFPRNCGVYVPSRDQRVDSDIPGKVFFFYEITFKIGLRLPLPSFIREVLSYYKIAPCQLMPKAWRVLLGLQVLSEEHKVNVSIESLQYSYYFRTHDHEKGRIQINMKPGRLSLIDISTNWDSSAWKKRYFLINKLGTNFFQWAIAQLLCFLQPTSSLAFSYVNTLSHTRLAFTPVQPTCHCHNHFFPYVSSWLISQRRCYSPNDVHQFQSPILCPKRHACPKSLETVLNKIMAPRWKGKVAKAKALAEPMSTTVSQLQSSLIESNSQGQLSGCTVLLAAHPEQIELLNRACFGWPIITTEKENQWFQLSFEEALYLCFIMKCIKIVGENKRIKSDEEVWHYMTSNKASFLIMFKAYTHLRKKNWVVRAGSQYGVDYVAYRHHPSLVHSEYAVLVLSDEDENRRLKVWSDFHCTLRLCGSVVKTLLVLHVSKNGDYSVSISSLEHYCVEERIVSRWNPEQNREDQRVLENESSKP